MLRVPSRTRVLSPRRTRAARIPGLWRSVFWLCAACLVLTGVRALPEARADDGARKGFDFGKDDKKGKTTPSKGPSRAPTGADAAGGPTDPIAALIEALRTWPDRKATRAAERLFLEGREAVPHLLQVLDRGDPALQAGAAWVLGKVGEPVHVQVILKSAAERTNASRADVFFDAAYELDPTQTRRWLISFLALSTKPVFRTKAAAFLEMKVGPEDQDRILNLLESEKAHVRIAGLQLLPAAQVEDAAERFLQALSDLSPLVAHAATRLLAHEPSEQMVQRLNQFAREAGARERSYSVLALVEIARSEGSNPFEDATVLELAGRRGLLHPEMLSAGAAAVGLAFGALDSRDDTVANLLDGRVVDTLINTLGGSHFRDFGSLAPSAFAALRRLSGTNLPDTAVAWAQWWRGARGSFRARRPLQKLEATDVPRAYVRFEAIEGNGRRVAAEFVAEGGAERPGAFLLERRVFEGLVAFLADEGIFDIVERGGVRANEHVAVTVGILNQRKRMTVSPDLVGATEQEREESRRKHQRIRVRLDALLAANIWQRYRDADKWPDHQAWWKANVDILAQASPQERRAMLQSAIVYAYDDMPDDAARAEGLVRLQRLESRLTETEVRELATQLTSGDAFGQLEADALRWIVAQGHPESREQMIQAVAARDEAEAREILAGLLLDGGAERIRAGFTDERTSLRAGAARAAQRFVESEAAMQASPEERMQFYARLRPGLEVLSLDDDVAVSVQALLALAYLGDDGIVVKLEDLYRRGDFGVKLEVTRALGHIPGQGSHQLLTRVMAEERKDGKSGALRAAALESMARTHHKDAVRLLRFYLLNDSDESVREAAARTLAELGTDEARFSIVEHLHGGEPDADRRARCVDVLGRFDSEVVPVLLRRYLGDRDTGVRAIAALRAADHNMSEAFPFLLELLRKGMGTQRDEARAGLENLTATRFAETGYNALAERYEEWYEDPRVKGLSDRAWFREALMRKGYDIGPLSTYLEGTQDIAAVPMLTRALRDEDAVIRRGAALALRRLTGRSFGPVDRGTSLAEAARIADQWAYWHEKLLESVKRPGGR